MRWLATSWLFAVACIQSSSVVCEDGRLCPAGQACDETHHLCVFPDQLTGCNGRSDHQACTFDNGAGAGECVDSVCIAPLCGDGLITAAELCDGAAPPIGTCLDFNYGYGTLTCSTNCSEDLSSCHQLGWRLTAVGASGRIGGFAEDAGVVWVANQFGVLKKDNGAWQNLGQVTASPVFGFGVWAGGGHVFVVGSGPSSTGYVLHFDGTTWSEQMIDPLKLTAVWGRSPTEVYAVGDNAIYKFDGNAWTKMTITNAAKQFTSIYGTATDIIVGGEDKFGTEGMVLRYNAGTDQWSNLDQLTGSTPPINGVWESSANDVVVVGPNSEIHFWDGGIWRQVPMPGTPVVLNAISGRSANEIYVVGDVNELGNMYRFDGASWLAMESSFAEALFTVYAGPTGAYAARGGDGLLEYQGAGWTTTMSTTTGAVNGLWSAGPDYAIAVGGDCALHEYVARTGVWSNTAPPTPCAQDCSLSPNQFISLDVFGFAKDNIYVGGTNVLYHKTAGWGCDTKPATITDLWTFGIWGSSPTDVYAVGQDGPGTVAHFIHTNGGTQWVDYDSKLPADKPKLLRAIWGSSATDIFLGGGVASPVVGTILHFDGNTATTMMLPADVGEIHALWGTGPHDVYAVGDHSTVLHYDGTAWTHALLPVGLTVATSANFTDVHGTGANDVYVVGGRAMLHYNGMYWEAVARTDTSQLEQVFALPGMVSLGLANSGAGRLLLGTLK